MLAASSTIQMESRTSDSASNPLAVIGMALGIATVVLYLLSDFMQDLAYLRPPATSCGLAGVVLSSKAYFDAREQGSFSRLATAGMVLSSVFLLFGLSIIGALWRVPMGIAFSILILRQLRLYHPLRQQAARWIRGSRSGSFYAADEEGKEQRVVLLQEEYQRLAFIGLCLGVAALILTFAPTTILLMSPHVGFWELVVWRMGLRIGFLCHVVGVWFCGLAFLQLLQTGGLNRTTVAGFVVNVGLAVFLLVVLLTSYFLSPF